MQLFSPSSQQKVTENIYKTGIPDLFYIQNYPHADDRGKFTEIALIPDLEAVLGQPFRLMQVNHTHSEQNVIRGMHAENWSKLINVLSGAAFCALSDVRPDSPTFAHTEYFILGHDHPDALAGTLYISPGIANSACVIQGPLEYIYFVDQLYRDRDKSGDVAISLFDPDLNIPWPIPDNDLIYSQRDKNAITLREKFLKNSRKFLIDDKHLTIYKSFKRDCLFFQVHN